MDGWSKSVRKTCAGVLALAVLLRLGGSSPKAVEPKAETASFLMYLATGRAGIYEPVEPTEPVLAVPEETPMPRRIAFTAEQAQELRVKYGTAARPDLEKLLTQPVSLDFSGQEPRILIVHTHATESYTPEPGWEYEASGNYRTLDENYNMIRVGERIADALNAAGIPTLQAKDYNDYPSYNDSYDRALEVIRGYLAEYPSIQMVIDVHRDAVENADGSQVGTAFSMDGKDTAQLLLVMGSDEGSLSHPDWEQNLSWALKLQVMLGEEDGELARPLSLRPARYNEHATPGSILLEVGTAGDTLQEALNAADAFAEALIDTIEGLGLRE